MAVWAAVLVACGPTELIVDAGPGADAGGPAGRITIESEPRLALEFAQEGPLVARYTVDGEPSAGVPIRFALEGAAHDATVSALSMETDADGRVETSVIAGSVRALFRVRVSAERAAPAYVDVSISDQGFGGLVARAEYEGRRSEPTRRILEVYSGIECDPPGGLPAFPDRMRAIDDPEVLEARWSPLPAGLIYTVVGRVEGPTGAVLATACVDGIEVMRDAETRVTLDFDDAGLVVDGTYDVDVELSPTESVGIAAGRLEDGGVAPLGDGAALFLDALEDELTERGETVASDALALERMGGGPDTDLAMRLDEAMGGPDLAARRFIGDLATRLSVVRLGGPLELALPGADLRATWSVERLEIGVIGDPDAPPPVVLDPGALDIEYAPLVELRWDATADLLRVDAWTMTLPLGTLIAATIDARADAAGSDGALLRDGAGCDALAAWVADSATVGPVCDAACVEAACLRALAPIVEAMRTAAMSMDDARDTVTVEDGSIAVSDADGDLEVDALEGRGLGGRWTGPLGLEADLLSADVVGGRIAID